MLIASIYDILIIKICSTLTFLQSVWERGKTQIECGNRGASHFTSNRHVSSLHRKASLKVFCIIVAGVRDVVCGSVSLR